MLEDAFYIRRLWSFSRAIDLALVDEEFGWSFRVPIGQRHGERVGYIAMSLGKMLKFSQPDLTKLLVAGLLHDIGAVGGFRSFHGDRRLMEKHCLLGANILEQFPGGDLLSPVVLYHHETPDPAYSALKAAQEEIPFMSKIIAFADKIDVHMPREHFDRPKREKLLNWVHEVSGRLLFPELVPAFEAMAEKEAFWLDLEQDDLVTIVLNLLYGTWEIPAARETEDAFTDDLVGIFADLIDQKSSFTMRHSRDVAENAAEIAAARGWDKEAQREIFMAGLVHDLGKLAVPRKILDKPAPLDNEEVAVIRTHTYYTYRLLAEAGFAPHIVHWAAHHHERLDGRGYPFKLTAERLDEGSRIMSIADMFSALTENRPYRAALQPEKALEIIGRGKGQAVDEELLKVAAQVLP